jgi:hypothetical protein
MGMDEKKDWPHYFTGLTDKGCRECKRPYNDFIHDHDTIKRFEKRTPAYIKNLEDKNAALEDRLQEAEERQSRDAYILLQIGNSVLRNDYNVKTYHISELPKMVEKQMQQNAELLWSLNNAEDTIIKLRKRLDENEQDLASINAAYIQLHDEHESYKAAVIKIQWIATWVAMTGEAEPVKTKIEECTWEQPCADHPWHPDTGCSFPDCGHPPSGPYHQYNVGQECDHAPQRSCHTYRVN